MPVLHIVNKSPWDRNSLDSCLRLANKEAAILLIEDAIYALRKNTNCADKITQALSRHSIYALKPDLEARGIGEDSIVEGVAIVDYDGFVKLASEYSRLQSWL